MDAEIVKLAAEVDTPLTMSGFVKERRLYITHRLNIGLYELETMLGPGGRGSNLINWFNLRDLRLTGHNCGRDRTSWGRAPGKLPVNNLGRPQNPKVRAGSGKILCDLGR